MSGRKRLRKKSATSTWTKDKTQGSPVRTPLCFCGEMLSYFSIDHRISNSAVKLSYTKMGRSVYQISDKCCAFAQESFAGNPQI